MSVSSPRGEGCKGEGVSVSHVGCSRRKKGRANKFMAACAIASRVNVEQLDEAATRVVSRAVILVAFMSRRSSPDG